MRLSEIKHKIGIRNDITHDFFIHSLAPLEYGGADDVSYIDQNQYLQKLKDSKVGAVLIKEEHASSVPPHIQPLIVENPHLAFAFLSEYFRKSEFSDMHTNYINNQNVGISGSAVIMPNVFIGKNVRIGDRTIIMPGVVISDHVRIGDDCKIYPNVVIYRESRIGNGVNIHAGSVIGSDGFGYAHTKLGEHVKIEHNGIVEIENYVEIGANTTIDRAVFGKTIIKQGAKIENLVQIGHNCIIGQNSILVAQVGLAGSTTTGRNVVFGGQAGTGGHIHIGDFTQIAGRGAVGKNLPPHTKWGGHPLMQLDEWMKFFVSLRRIVKKQEKDAK